MKKYCKDCKFSQFVDNEFIRCVRFPPQYYVRKKVLQCGYPIFLCDAQICGEFQEKREV